MLGDNASPLTCILRSTDLFCIRLPINYELVISADIFHLRNVGKSYFYQKYGIRS